MEPVIIFLLKTVGSGVIGHYLKKQLEKIDTALPPLFETGNEKQIEKYVHEVGLESQLSILAADTLNNSFVIPSIPSNAATFADRVELFQNILNFGFAYSNKIKCDLLLPGSLLGPDSLTLFERNSDNIPMLQRQELRITIKDSLVGDNNVYFIPCSSTELADKIMSDYRTFLVDRRQETLGYIAYQSDRVLPNAGTCAVGAVSAGSCYFILSSLVRDRFPKYFTVDRGNPPKLGDWSAGVGQMLAWAPKLDELGAITQEEIGGILATYDRLKSLY